MTPKTKLELTWIGKETRPKLEPRILLEDRDLSYRAQHRVTDGDSFDNILIQGDNLLALKALEQGYAGKVKCVYIDPPFNTGGYPPAAFMRPREECSWTRVPRRTLRSVLTGEQRVG
jgi:16S rRNA G966 N2-methylase RsmD